MRQEPIAVVGMSCRFPQSPDVAAFWQLLLDGRDAVRPIPEGRWNLDALRRWNEGRPLPRPAVEGGWLDRVRDFDHVFFRMSPREARTMDPKQRLALEVTYEAFEDAGVSPQQVRGDRQVGLFLATAQSEYLMRFYFRGEVVGSKADRYSGPGNDASFSAGRISAMFGLEGPSVNLNTACSASLVAVHQAMRALHDGAADVVAAGGVAIIESPEHSLVMDTFGVLSPEARCKAFDASADGYVRAEGCGMVVLKRLADAVADGDCVHAVLRGSAVNHNGLSDNLMAPDADAQVRLVRRALDQAALPPDAIDVVEAHGTGTSVGDPTELEALTAVFGGRAPDRPLVVSSVKTNIGHLEVGAGVAGLIKAVLSVQHGTVPRHLHLRALNPAIPRTLPFTIPTSTVPWPATAAPRRALVNSFGISGINAAVVVEQAPQPAPRARTPRATSLLPLSAFGDAPLRALATAHADRLAAGSDLPDVAWSAATGRDGLPLRACVVAADTATAIAGLRAIAEGRPHPAVRNGEARGTPKVGWLFTGQGAQFVGMATPLAAEPAFAEALAEVDTALRPHLGVSIRDVMDGRVGDVNDTAFTQPALFAVAWATARLWSSLGVEPDLMVGHSIGEIAAAAYAGVFSLDDAARLVAARGRLMSALPREGAMAAIFADVDTVRAALVGVEGVDVAADNGPQATVVSGRAEGVAEVLAAFDARGVAGKRLTVSHAFHSPLMEPMLAAFREVVASIPMRPPARAIVSNLDGRLADGSMATPDYWVRHVRHAVRFREGVAALVAAGVTVAIELGPDNTAVGMARRAVRDAKLAWLPSSGREQGHATWLEAVAQAWTLGALPRWTGFVAGFPARRVDLPRYPFQRREHWVDDPGPWARAEGTEPRAIATEGPGAWRGAWVPIVEPTLTPIELGTWIVGIDRSGIGEALARGLSAAGHRVVRVVPAEVDGPRPDGTHGLGLGAFGGFRALVAAHAADLRGIVHTWTLDVPSDPPERATAWTDRQRTASLASVGFAQALAGVSAPGAALVTVTRGGQAIVPGESPALGQAGPWGVARVLALEHRAVPNLRIDLDPHRDDAEAVLAWLLARPTDEDQLARRRGRTWALRLARCATSGVSWRPTPGTTQLVTGGLGAIGLAVAEHLAARGATHLALVGRSAPTAQAASRLDRLRAAGVDVSVLAVDVADLAALRVAMAPVARRAPLGGVFHAAGVLADGPILTCDPARFARVFPAKVEGAWNLHRLTEDTGVDAFVLFSSVTSLLGAPGQVNYAAANAFLDALAHVRRARGLPGVAIQWGPWGEIGMAAGLGELMASRGMGALRTADGLAGLDALAADLPVEVAYMDVRLPVLLARDPTLARAPLWRDALAASSARGEPTPAPPPPSIATPPATPAAPATPATPAAPVPEVLAHLTRLAEELLGFRPGELDPGRPLAWQGFDSVMAVDLHRRIRDTTGVELPLDRVLPGPRLTEIADEVKARGPRAAAASAPPPAPTPPLPPPTPTPSAPVGDLVTTVTRLVEGLLGFNPGEIDPSRPLAWQGFDSVMAVDLHKQLRARLGVELPLDRLLHGPRIDEIVEALVAVGAAAGPPAPPPAPAAAVATSTPPPLAEAPGALPSMPAEPGPTATHPPVPAGLWIAAATIVTVLFLGALWFATRAEDEGPRRGGGDATQQEEPPAKRKRRQP